MGRCNGTLKDAELPGESPLKKSSETENRMNADSRMRNAALLVTKTRGSPASIQAVGYYWGYSNVCLLQGWGWPKRNKT